MKLTKGKVIGALAILVILAAAFLGMVAMHRDSRDGQ